MPKTILSLTPIFLSKIWGWEKWHLSCFQGKGSFVANDEKGERVNALLSEHLLKAGYGPEQIKRFPLLIKTIRADSPLSLQVHPDDQRAELKGSLGKSECWYILEAAEESFVHLNFKKKVALGEVKKHIEDNSLEEIMQRVKVEAGDLIYLPAGTVHAIGSGITLLEVQQNSDITYRLYDYGRGRELHLQEGLEAIDYGSSNKKIIKKKFTRFQSPYFELERKSLKAGEVIVKKVTHSFMACFVLEGRLMVSENEASGNEASGNGASGKEKFSLEKPLSFEKDDLAMVLAGKNEITFKAGGMKKGEASFIFIYPPAGEPLSV